MRRILKLSILIIAIFTASGCKKSYLDINTNTNAATSSTPELVLPAALNNTASNFITYFDFGAFTAGYEANAGGYSYAGSIVLTYNWNASSNNGLFNNAFSDLRSYQYIINSTTGVTKYALYNAVARIMKSYYYQILIDEYGRIPYSEALQGSDNVTPKYDDPAVVYQSLVTEIDASITQLKTYGSNSAVTALGTADIMLGGSVTKWIQFANNIKLRILTRAQNSSISSFVSTAFGTFSSEGFLTDDVVVNPGYVSTSDRQNPLWNTYHSTYTGTNGSYAASRIPTTWMYSFYNGTKLNDATRGGLIYKNFASGSTPINQLGNETNVPSWISGNNAWYIGTGTGVSATETQGILKSRVMGQLLMPAAETYFLLAEAALNGRVLSGDAATNFDSGIKASYNYLQKTGASTASATAAAQTAYLTAYKAANANSYLVNYNLAATNAQRLEAIITQKYIALNFVNGFEAWQEYKRTGYPTVSGTGATTTFASTQSIGTTGDRLPVRSIYPTTEYNLNPNVPAGLNPFTSKIFWDNN
ncbi:SusD/RagB family nutrient-binding outer membrane lipoprotein [Pedobacter rhodius]|uniref:SusD/RagB family nutrient-binding outer membrane lipoprotein n=1 Tax=Pedobacter rhodius TaxID=3004098 RepID=A0ABT4KWA5_9SPHI|nr:SusD/RagB family nutrient-binding outer membrane lipoprotein [Pedobacter sp. SJ11]MCZ4223197.1 SusD/RagB family nutrient-binding outer membrane lipoprotein [Pedobacter sp. SJ11]